MIKCVMRPKAANRATIDVSTPSELYPAKDK